jgi:hypothetical protein
MERKNKPNQGASGTGSSGPGMVNPGSSDAPFSAHRAFVVQFRKTAGDPAGRVEHIASGEAALFSCEHDLFDFFRRILRTIADDKGVRSQ